MFSVSKIENKHICFLYNTIIALQISDIFQTGDPQIFILIIKYDLTIKP